MAFGDLFNDGHIDVVVNNMDGTPSLFRNVVQNDNHWIAFRLIGSQEISSLKRRSPVDAVAATIYLTAGGMRQRFDVTAGGSFASSSDQRPHFGLGHATKIDKLEIVWPSGRTEPITQPLSVDRFYTIQEQKGVVNDR
jgi:hypothetical protein